MGSSITLRLYMCVPKERFRVYTRYVIIVKTTFLGAGNNRLQILYFVRCCRIFTWIGTVFCWGISMKLCALFFFPFCFCYLKTRKKTLMNKCACMASHITGLPSCYGVIRALFPYVISKFGSNTSDATTHRSHRFVNHHELVH